MRALRKTHSTSLSCSCTSCVYKSESDHPSLQHLMLKGSKVDRLYYGKYIPLREKKLLDKLVRTRAVYDDIRAQLVSDSTSSFQKNVNFKVNKQPPANELGDTEKSSAVLELVNLVDKGAALKSPNLSECCSCCSCSSKIHLREHEHKVQKRRHSQRDNYERERLKYDVSKKKGVKFLPKHIKSDPCTCTFQFLDLHNKRKNDDKDMKFSLQTDEKIKPRPRKLKTMAKKSLQNIVDSKTNIKNKITAGVNKIKDSKTLLEDTLAIHANKSLEKIQKIKGKFKKEKQSPVFDQVLIDEDSKVQKLKIIGKSSYDKIRESQTRLKNILLEGAEVMEAHVKKSADKIKQAKNKIETNLRSSLDKLDKRREKNKPGKKFKSPSPQQKEIALKIRKDSIVKFKEDLNRKQYLKDWICEEECIEGTCIPRECFERIKLKRAQKLKKSNKRDNGNISNTSHLIRNIGISPIPSKIRDREQSLKTITNTKIKSYLSTGDTKGIQPVVNIKTEKQKIPKPQIKDNKKGSTVVEKTQRLTSSLISEPKSSSRQVVRIGSSFSFNVEFYKEKTPPSIPKYNNQSPGITLSRKNNKKNRTVSQRQKDSQLSLKHSKHEKKQKGHALKRCFCTLKLKTKPPKKVSQKSVSTMSSLDRRNKNKPYNVLLYECEPGICTPGICNPYECLKLQSKRLNSHSKQSYTSSRKTKSTSSFTTKVKSAKAKQVQSAIIPRRKQIMEKEKLQLRPRKNIHKKPINGNVVRIGSSFSFNIEFYKNSNMTKQPVFENRPDISSFSMKPKIKEHNIQDKKQKNKDMQKRHNLKKITTGTETVDYSEFYVKTRNKSTKTGRTPKYLSQLDPFECEPFTCIPGECDPSICLENIRKRYKKTKEVSLGTTNPENRSTYSYTEKRYKTAFVQSKPDMRERKILVKNNMLNFKKVRQHTRPNKVFEQKTKQAVKIGSSFSFNIEFSKTHTGKDEKLDLKPVSKPIKISTTKNVKQKGLGIEKRKISHADTQIDRVKQVEKSSVVGPMLKRCFCTLNLHKKHKREHNNKMNIFHTNKVYTVNTALIQNNISSNNILSEVKESGNFHNSMALKRSTLNLNSTYTKLLTKQSLEITSDLSLNVELVKKSMKDSYCISKKNLQKCTILDNESYFKRDSLKLTGITKYLKRCFCTMNMQYENKFKKLKPYECEPGICIPGKCDPYECQKLIMKRMHKGYYSKLTGTESSSRSFSSSQTQRTPTQSHLTNVALQPQTKNKEFRKISPKVSQKQAVRVGSSFSFDIEFYKNLSPRQSNKYKYDKHVHGSDARLHRRVQRSPREMKGAKTHAAYGTRDSESQFDRQIKHQSSHALQEMNRCFCTLKLHKNGKFKQKDKNRTISDSPVTLTNEFIGIKTVNRGQNTKPFKVVADLLPYECEPGICMPGECNPYECLALINKRNLQQRGTDAIRISSTASSNTMGIKKKYKTRAVTVQPKTQSVRDFDKRRYTKKSHDTKRQAVRIGSSFNFNIEFYKDSHSLKPQQDIIKNVISTHRSKPEKPKPKRTRKSTTSPISQTQILQTMPLEQKNMATTVKPFLERCFCTLKLRNRRKIKERHNVHKSKFRSVMTMTKNSGYKRRLDPNECEPGICVPYNCDIYKCEKNIQKRLKKHQKKYDSFKNNYTAPKVVDNYELLPYECEPYFCTPGDCDPLVCLERIKNRNLKSTGVEAKYINTRSIGSTSNMKNKNKRIQFRRVSKKTKPTNVVKQIPTKTASLIDDTGHKQAVRIGSNFSFNIEFFKDQGLHGNNLLHNDSEIHTKDLKQQPYKKPKQHKLVQGRNHIATGHSQTLKHSKSVKSGIIPNLERCFCTLALRNNKNTSEEIYRQCIEEQIQTSKHLKTKYSNKNHVQGTKSTASAVSTFFKKCFCSLKLNASKLQNSPHLKFQIKPQKHTNRFKKLKPYECEPNTCIPGKCDPYECEKRIKKRLLRENATGTNKTKLTSHSTFMPTSKSNKSHYVNTKVIQSRSKEKAPIVKKPRRAINSLHEGRNRQSVRIGSTFSFDVEFVKDKSAGDTIYRKKNFETESKMATKAKYKSTGQQQTHRGGKYNASQLANIQTQSNGTITDPLLKRCFCTLQLHKSAASVKDRNIVKIKPKAMVHNKMTHTRNTTLSYNMTSPYECPPLMCTPYQCDPYECEKKLRKLNNRSQAVGTKEKRTKHKSVEIAPFITKTQKIQSKITQNAPECHKERNIVEIPRFTNYLNKENWQSVKVGSNVSFNIEFYKEKSPSSQIYKYKDKEPDLKPLKQDIISDDDNCSSHRKKNMVNKIVPSLRLKHLRNTESQVVRSKMASDGSNTVNRLKRCFCTLKLQKYKTTPQPYPQIFEVRRVEVQNNKRKPMKQINVDDKYVSRKCNKSMPNNTTNDNEMQTILSYQPKKFGRKFSRTLLSENKINTQQNNKRHSHKWLSKKRLTRKQSGNSINLTTRSCRCGDKLLSKMNEDRLQMKDSINMRKSIKDIKNVQKIFKKNQTNVPIFDDIRYSNSHRKSMGERHISKTQTSKGMILLKKIVDDKRNDSNKLIRNEFEAGDSSVKSKIKTKSICPCVEVNKKDDSIQNKTQFTIEDTSKSGKCPFCKVCYNNGFGYGLLTKFNTCIKKIQEWPLKTIKNRSKKAADQRLKKVDEIKPLFNVYLEADSLNIINKEEVTEKVSQLQTKRGKRFITKKDEQKKHDKSCRCCICIGKKGTGGKRSKKISENIKKKSNSKVKPTCVCGSQICATNAAHMKKIKEPSDKKDKIMKPCYCGSPICAEETAIMKAIATSPGKIMCICQEEIKKRKLLLAKKEKKEYEKKRKILTEQHNKEDKQRRKKRLKDAKMMEQSIKGNKNDVLLVAESVVDVAKLGVTGIADIFRIVYRCAKDPKHSWRTIKSMAKNPSLIGKTLKSAYDDSGVAATTRRVRMRISSMGSLNDTKKLLEQNQITNYLLHIADKDPKKRLRKVRKQKRKERIDFGCNLYMSSLRKRPFMFIFDRCPSFYPHCLSIVNVWKQFAEVMTFLLAVVVWSPCIFGMEICRALLCCTLCTG